MMVNDGEREKGWSICVPKFLPPRPPPSPPRFENTGNVLIVPPPGVFLCSFIFFFYVPLLFSAGGGGGGLILCACGSFSLCSFLDALFACFTVESRGVRLCKVRLTLFPPLFL
eukprot:Hpha_TRINITY_DN16658_c2_g1::TRINITY_DN16658_c2_g1_i1::g.183446::m.183446